MSKNNEADELSVKDAAEQAVSQVAEAGKGVVEAARATGEKYILDKWTYHVPFHTIPSEDIKETFTTDVVIAGAGTSGKAAALAARQAGAQVIQIDRHTTFRYGGGHQMAMRIGAVMEPGPHAPMAHASWAGPLGVDPFLRVNLEGVRYENEDVPAQSVANSLTRQPGMKAWQVFDSKWEEEVPLMGVGLGRYYEVSDKLRENVEKETIMKADTIEELAQKMNVPVKAFKATVERYNQMAKMGKDMDFGKRADRLTTVEKPPFYAGTSRRDFLIVMGGLNTNIKLQPLDADRKVIPGLYCAGNTVGNRFAIDYPTMCPGLTHGMAYVTGRLAGSYAAAEEV